MATNRKGNIVKFKSDAEFFYRIGTKYADRKIFDKALKYLSKAVEVEPFNADYQFNLAGVLAELKEDEKSNTVLLNILKNIDPTLTECYFGIGCNYFDIGNFKKAKEYFEKYIFFDPEGYFVDEAYDALYYLQIYDPGLKTKPPKRVSKLYEEGKKLMESGFYKRACLKLEKAVEADPEAVEPRLELSRAYYLTDEKEKAASLANSVLKLEPQNVTAYCELTLIYSETEKLDLYIKCKQVLPRLEITSLEELLKLFETYIKLEEYAGLEKILAHYLGDKKEAVVQLETTAKSMELDDEAKAALKKALEYKKRRNHGEAPQEKEQTAKEERIPSIRWRKEWEAVIDCAIRNKEFDYQESYSSELKSIWMNFIKRVYPEHVPVIRKLESWAAALEYIYCDLHLIGISKKKLAQKYNISISTLDSKLKDLVQ